MQVQYACNKSKPDVDTYDIEVELHAAESVISVVLPPSFQIWDEEGKRDTDSQTNIC